MVNNDKLPLTAPTRNWRFSAPYDSFVVKQTFVLRMKFSGENRQLLVAAKRYATLKKTTKWKSLTLKLKKPWDITFMP